MSSCPRIQPRQMNMRAQRRLRAAMLSPDILSESESEERPVLDPRQSQDSFLCSTSPQSVAPDAPPTCPLAIQLRAATALMPCSCIVIVYALDVIHVCVCVCVCVCACADGIAPLSPLLLSLPFLIPPFSLSLSVSFSLLQASATLRPQSSLTCKRPGADERWWHLHRAACRILSILLLPSCCPSSGTSTNECICACKHM